ncbi:hypothetical protein MYCTH_2312336 [Thermothelomyces thermophilus ATCC 42464]|uniref:Cytokinesis regulator n=1 Tax=Thermothelomyces thermophilus (strain ATCC 42464 / BCRC 31852 / DSM 1799) TaxID=573729 RepID=G2QQB4_THET4|nr:uncharacterized protein MYCTH_2312336 [Thermothelomyces thermophilus ATCC 42464]AEO61777.1 hypothetical protein MYCTH_2312336 [Thermothelomyces thermophilus ATCC 42464]
MDSSTLRLKARPHVEEEIENWDDDDDFVFDGDDIAFPSLSNLANISSNRRDSQSSFRSDFESVHGEEEKQVHLPDNDEKSTLDAIAAAAKAGIPLPKNVPPSALMGGTIKRLGGRKIKKIIQEDWVDDLEFPDAGQVLQIKDRDGAQFPEVLRQVSNSAQPSPSKPPKDLPTMFQDEQKEEKPTTSSSLVDLEKFRDGDDDDFFGDGGATIKVSKRRVMPKSLSLITSPTPQRHIGDTQTGDDDFEKDLELPEDGHLKLSAKRDIPPKTPTFANILDDLDWTEGSLGTRFGGTRREAQSTRSSSVSAFSPSISSSVMESEDEIFDGLIIPNGPLDFGERLKRRRKSRSPERIPEEPSVTEELGQQDTIKQKSFKGPLMEPLREEKGEEKEDFLDGLEIGDGEIFDSRKLTLNRNIQVKTTRPASPSRPKASVALKFTNKPVTASRLPRPMGSMASHERSHTQSSLEPVSESGGPIQRAHSRRSLSRMGGHSAHSSVTSLASSTTSTRPSSTQTVAPSTPRRRESGQGTSQGSLGNESATTNAQLLRMKRSLPAMRGTQSPARPQPTRGYERPPSRAEQTNRAPPTLRPKTPVERTRPSESAAALARKAPVPFVPAGASATQSHNVNAKPRTFRRHDSETSIEYRPSSRAVSRSAIRSPSPRLYRSAEKATPESHWGKMSVPKRARNFGDGHELDAFDDLPTSTQAEAKFLKQPSSAKSQTRTRGYQNIPDRNVTPSPRAPPSSRVDNVPSFARDTAASRIARETNLAQRNPSGVIAPLTAQRVAQLSAKGNSNAQSHFTPPTAKAKKVRRSPQSKPHLIANLNPPRDAKMVKGMWYNPEMFRWEGNDNALNAFEVPATSSSTGSGHQHMVRERETATPRPALITNIGVTKGVQVVGGMVFDPQNMCWLKLAPQNRSGKGGALDGLDAFDDEEDVFKDIPDLEERTMASSDGGNPRVSDVNHEWPVGEEFDVGPEFVRRQREEEERWRKKCHLWINNQADRGDAWKWAIRDIVNEG